MRHGSKPEPFLRLGDCYLAHGLSAAALSTYRGATRSFGPSVIHRLTLRMARAEYRVGQIAAGRKLAPQRVKKLIDRAPTAPWRPRRRASSTTWATTTSSWASLAGSTA